MKKAGDREYMTDPLTICQDMGLNIKESSLIIDGGNVVKVGDWVIMTEKVLVENPGNERRLKKQLED